MKVGKSRMLFTLGALLVLSVALYYALPVLASSVTSVGLEPSKYTYVLSEVVTLNVRARWETSGIVSFGGCIRYVITTKEVTWFGLWRTEIARASYGGNCYFGSLPNPVYIDQSISFTASKLGKGSHTLFAEVKLASGMLFSWDSRSSPNIKLAVT